MEADIEFAMRLTHSEAEAARRLAVAMRSLGNLDAVAHPVGGGLIISLGAGRFVNRALFTAAAVASSAISDIIGFFTARGLPPSLQLPGWIDDATSRELSERGFTPDWSRSLLAATTEDSRPPAPSGATVDAEVVITEVSDDLVETWLGVLADGNETPAPLRPISDEYGRAAHAVPGSTDLLASLDAQPVACGSVQIVDGVGWLGGAATLPHARGRGLQAQLLERRIAMAARLGADTVAATSLPDTVSERNLVRSGLTIVDVQTVWTLTA